MFFGRDSELDRLASLWRKRVWGEKVLRILVDGPRSVTEIASALATDWFEALPVGNGRLGAMVYGGVEGDRFAAELTGAASSPTK